MVHNKEDVQHVLKITDSFANALVRHKKRREELKAKIEEEKKKLEEEKKVRLCFYFYGFKAACLLPAADWKI